MIDYSLLDFLENILNESYLVVDVDFLGDGNGDGVSNWGGDLNVVQNLLNVDLGGKLNGHLLGVLRVSTDGGENLLLGDDGLTKTNGTTESGLQDVRSVTSDDGSVFVVDLGVDDLGRGLVDGGNWGRLVDDLLDGVLHNRGGNFDGVHNRGGVLHNGGSDFNGVHNRSSDLNRLGHGVGNSSGSGSNVVVHHWGGGERSRASDGTNGTVAQSGSTKTKTISQAHVQSTEATNGSIGHSGASCRCNSARQHVEGCSACSGSQECNKNLISKRGGQKRD